MLRYVPTYQPTMSILAKKCRSLVEYLAPSKNY